MVRADLPFTTLQEPWAFSGGCRYSPTTSRILVQLGEAEAARALGKDTLRRCRRVLGPDHVITLGTAAALTLALAQLGQGEPARALGQDTLQRCRRAFGPDHPATLYITQKAGIGHLVLGDDAVGDRPSRPL
jgi:hypothetical protein